MHKQGGNPLVPINYKMKEQIGQGHGTITATLPLFEKGVPQWAYISGLNGNFCLLNRKT
jgi:hypothetical protein